MRTGPVHKIDEYEMTTAWGEVWHIIILGDKETNGKMYAQAIIKGKK